MQLPTSVNYAVMINITTKNTISPKKLLEYVSSMTNVSCVKIGDRTARLWYIGYKLADVNLTELKEKMNTAHIGAFEYFETGATAIL